MGRFPKPPKPFLWGAWQRMPLNRVPLPERAWTTGWRMNGIYSVRIYKTDAIAPDGFLLSITRRDGHPIRGAHWVDLQRIKDELGFDDFWGCEWYPPHKLIQDPAHIYYMYLWPKGHAIPEACCLTSPRRRSL